MLDKDNWLDDEVWDLTWRGEPVTTVPQLIALGRTQFSGSDEEVLKKVTQLPVFRKAPDSLARSALQAIGERITYTQDKKRRVSRSRKGPGKTKRVAAGEKSVFRLHNSVIPGSTLGIGYSSIYPNRGDSVAVKWINEVPGDRENDLEDVLNRLDGEHPGLVEASGIRSILFTGETGAPPYLAGSYAPDIKQIRILVRTDLPDPDGQHSLFDRTPERMFFTLVHETGHAVGNGAAVADLYESTVRRDPVGWFKSLDDSSQKRWVSSVTKYRKANEGGKENPYEELFADSFSQYLLAGSTDDDRLDKWVQAVLDQKGIRKEVEKAKLNRKVAGTFSSGYPVSPQAIEAFLLGGDYETGEGMAPDELSRIVSAYSVGTR